MEVVNKKLVLVVIMIGIFCAFFMWQNISDKETKLEMVSLNNETKSSNMFAIMLEQEDGTYKESDDNSWPSLNSYFYNELYSGCIDINGNKIENALTFAKENNIAIVKTDKTSYCYLYFEYLPKAYAIYSADDTSLRFYKNTDYEVLGDTYNGLTVTEVYTDFLNGASPWRDSSYKTTITSVVVEEEIQPTNTAQWFEGMTKVSYFDLTFLDTSNISNMYSMFNNAGLNALTFEILGLEKWNTSKVTNMGSMFWVAGRDATEWNIGGISTWDTSNVTTIGGMFYYAGVYANSFELDLSKWNTSNINDMSIAFAGAGQRATTFKLNLSGWNTSNVTNMNALFTEAGRYSLEWDVGDITKWNTSNVTNMSGMFNSAGRNATYTLNLSTKEVIKEDGTTYIAWDVSKVTDYSNFNLGVESKVIAPTWVN